jgi:hypothetical protein
MQTIQLENTAIEIPSNLDWRDDEGTLVAYLPKTDFANLRFTLLSIKDTDGNPSPGAGVRTVMNRCDESNAKLERHGETVWYYATETATEGAKGSLMHYWYVGMDAYMLIISCFVDAKMAKSAKTAAVLASVEPTIRSFRKFHDA